MNIQAPNKPIKKKDNVSLYRQLQQQADKYLHNNNNPYRSFILDIDGIEREAIAVSNPYKELFNDYLLTANKENIKYLFDEVIGYDPDNGGVVIISRDLQGRAIDIISYDSYETDDEDWEEFCSLYDGELINNSLYALQPQIEKMALETGYCFIGTESLKDTLISFIYGIPYIGIREEVFSEDYYSIEFDTPKHIKADSTLERYSSMFRIRAIEYLQQLQAKGIKLIGINSFSGEWFNHHISAYTESYITIDKNILAKDITLSDYLSQQNRKKVHYGVN